MPLIVGLLMLLATCTVVGICVLAADPTLPVSVVNLVLFNVGALLALTMFGTFGNVVALLAAAAGGRLFLLVLSGGRALLTADLD